MLVKMRARLFLKFACALLTGALALALVACGGKPTGTGVPNPTQTLSDTDVAFAQSMIPHHEQAIAMARMAQTHAHDPAVKQLAAQIEAEQTPEIDTMTGWLQAWGTPAPTATTGAAPPTSGMMSSPGMMPSMPDWSKMMDLQGADFDRMFLQMMITHHEDAIHMAKTEQASGANPAAKQLAKNIETSQAAQITQMQQMLSTVGPTHS
jgi:uncharacterized protein (DUF305 family)